MIFPRVARRRKWFFSLEHAFRLLFRTRPASRTRGNVRENQFWSKQLTPYPFLPLSLVSRDRIKSNHATHEPRIEFHIQCSFREFRTSPLEKRFSPIASTGARDAFSSFRRVVIRHNRSMCSTWSILDRLNMFYDQTVSNSISFGTSWFQTMETFENSTRIEQNIRKSKFDNVMPTPQFRWRIRRWHTIVSTVRNEIWFFSVLAHVRDMCSCPNLSNESLSPK